MYPVDKCGLVGGGAEVTLAALGTSVWLVAAVVIGEMRMSLTTTGLTRLVSSDSCDFDLMSAQSDF